MMVFKKVNLECIIQMVTLLILDLILYKALSTGKMKYYIHPRIEKYLWISTVALLVLIIFMIPRLFTPKRRMDITSCIILMLPLISGVCLSATNKATYTPHNEKPAQGAFKLKEGANPKNFTGDTKQKPGILCISDEDYLKWYMDASARPEKYMGKTIRIKGLVYRRGDFGKNEFVPARMAMSCCAADMVPVGFLCKSSEAPLWPDDEWVYVTAAIVIEYEKHLNKERPILYAIKITKAERPEEEYVYP